MKDFNHGIRYCVMKMFYSQIAFVLLGVLYVEATVYTDWTVWLWLDASLNLDPDVVWNDSGSAYNDVNSRNVTYFVTSGTSAFRSESIDNWNDHQPNRLRVVYRNVNGLPLYTVVFNTTGKTSSDWFTDITFSPHQDVKLSMSYDFTSFSTSFTLYDDSAYSRRYFASFVRKADTTTDYVIASGRKPLYLPASDVVAGDCHYSLGGSNTLLQTVEMINLTRIGCSSYCREQNILYAAVHNVSCSCLSAQPSGGGLTACTHPCAGDPSEICGGFDPDFPTDAIIFSYVNTDIDTSSFGTDTELTENFSIDGPLEKTLGKAYYVYGLRLIIDVGNTPVTITMKMTYKAEPCADSSLTNETFTEIITVPDGSPLDHTIEPIYVQCTYISLYDSADNPIAFTVDVTLITLKAGEFLTAAFLSIEASWEIPTNSTEECECECWIYNMLYGPSPFQNLTYSEKEEALQEITQQIEKELSVNRSELSSTIRAKTSADDSRPSAVVVGYTLGVALLSLSLGMIFISDIPKILGSIHILFNNIQSRFGRPNLVPTDVRRKENS